MARNSSAKVQMSDKLQFVAALRQAKTYPKAKLTRSSRSGFSLALGGREHYHDWDITSRRAKVRQQLQGEDIIVQ